MSVAESLRAKDREGHTALHCAAAGGKHHVVELLFATMRLVEDAALAAGKLPLPLALRQSPPAASKQRHGEKEKEEGEEEGGGEGSIDVRAGVDWPPEKEWLYATLSNGEDAAILATKNGFRDLASKITRRMYLDTRKNALLGDILFGGVASFKFR